MGDAYLFRVRISRICTIGLLIANGEKFWTLELPWRDNERNNSCIPNGYYECDYLPRSSSGKYRSVYHVKDVKDRSGILIHNGNLPSHTKGCILLGLRKGQLNGKTAVLSSKSAMSKFVRSMNKESFKLRVVGWNG